MNFIPAVPQPASGAHHLRIANGVVLPVPPDRSPRYAAHAGRHVLLGIRAPRS